MLSFTSSLSPDSEAFAIFVTEKYEYKDKRDILPKNIVQKIKEKKLIQLIFLVKKNVS